MLKFVLFVCLLLAIHTVNSRNIPKQRQKWKKNCGYESCPLGKPDMLNVHLIPHTHMDVGWLKTADQYYYGDRQDIQRAGVQYIIDSVIDQLSHDPNKKFILVETAFIWRWWRQQSDRTRHLVKKFVSSGQLEFIGGGWSMNDEANPVYNAIIDNMSWGFRRLNDTFGSCAVPKVAWQIDPFGHSKEQASLFSQMYFDGLFVGRIDYQDKYTRVMNKTLEMIWKGSNNLGNQADLFTGVLPNSYSPPDGFCFDLLCNDEPIMDDPNLKGYNVDRRVDEFISIVNREKTLYRANHIVMTMGNDFNYQNADVWFKNLDKLIYHTNKRQNNGSKVNLMYSTPSCYLYSLNKAGIEWPTKTDDFFPYSSDPHAFWTGYFTSRPAFKKYVKDIGSFLQVVKQLSVLANLTENDVIELNSLREALGEGLHHDAITGTAKQAVDRDYRDSISIAVNKTQEVVNDAYQKLIPKTKKPVPKQIFCNLLNETNCNFTESHDSFTITLYNPLSKEMNKNFRFPVSNSAYKVLDYNGKSVESQVYPSDQVDPLKPKSSYVLLFSANLPALGYSTYFVKKTNNIEESIRQRTTCTQATDEDVTIENKYIRLTVDGKTGLLKTIHNLIENISINVMQSFYYYQGMAGNNSGFENRASGAYIFRPDGTVPFAITSAVKVTKYEGAVVEEIKQVFSSWLTQTIRLYKSSQNVEFDWTVGPIPVDDYIGKEIITRFDTDLETDSKFFTDANGREIQERVRDKRFSWNVTIKEPISGNYYPVNSRIYLQDKKRNIQFNVLNDRSQGGTSIKDGSVELMVHRRLLYDDAFGVGEPLNETGRNGMGLIVKGQHFVTVSTIPTGHIYHRFIGLQNLLMPSVSFGTYDGINEKEYMDSYCTWFSGINAKNLPFNVNILTLEPWKHGNVLLRLENFFEKSEIPAEIPPKAKVSIKDVFNTLNITSVREMTLGANQFLDEAHKLVWNSDNKIDSRSENKTLGNDLVVTLDPMEIRTFVLYVD